MYAIGQTFVLIYIILYLILFHIIIFLYYALKPAIPDQSQIPTVIKRNINTQEATMLASEAYRKPLRDKESNMGKSEVKSINEGKNNVKKCINKFFNRYCCRTQ